MESFEVNIYDEARITALALYYVNSLAKGDEKFLIEDAYSKACDSGQDWFDIYICTPTMQFYVIELDGLTAKFNVVCEDLTLEQKKEIVTAIGHFVVNYHKLW